MDNTEHKSSAVKSKQQRNLMIAGIIILLVLWGLSSLLFSSPASHQASEKNTTIKFASPLNHVDEASVWVEKAQNNLAKEQKTNQGLQQQLQLLAQAKAAQEKTSQSESQQLQILQNQVQQLQQQLAGKSLDKKALMQATSNAAMQDNSGISEDKLSLSANNPYQQNPAIPSRNPATYVPAGTFVRAVMLGGADASAGVNSQNNPTPTLFRLLDRGTLPNHRHSHLKDCVATAAAIGDISSERGFMRLERLSCVSPNQEVIDIPVEGTVFGPEGKNGVRGVPLWREGALLKRAFVAGALSGISSGISQQYTTSSVSPLGSTSTVNPSDIFKYGAAQGTSNAMDKVADYHIRRADQYHPVIQLGAGTIVDVVFLKGFYLDGQKHAEKSENVIPPFEFTTSPAPATLATLPLTPKQIDALKSQPVQ